MKTAATTAVKFLRHNGEFNAQWAGGKFARALASKTGIFCVIRETPAFYFIETNDETKVLCGDDKLHDPAPLQVSKKTMKLAGRDAPRGGKFSIVEF